VHESIYSFFLRFAQYSTTTAIIFTYIDFVDTVVVLYQRYLKHLGNSGHFCRVTQKQGIKRVDFPNSSDYAATNRKHGGFDFLALLCSRTSPIWYTSVSLTFNVRHNATQILLFPVLLFYYILFLTPLVLSLQQFDKLSIIK